MSSHRAPTQLLRGGDRERARADFAKALGLRLEEEKKAVVLFPDEYQDLSAKVSAAKIADRITISKGGSVPLVDVSSGAIRMVKLRKVKFTNKV